MTSSSLTTMIRHTARTGLLAGMALLSSCEIFTPPPPMPPPPFSPAGRPRYGFNGTSSPSYNEAPPALPGNGRTSPDANPQTKPPRIVRDPSNTTVNIDPPKPRDTRPPDMDTPPVIVEKPESTPPAVTPPAKPSAREDLPYGTPVVGKKGFVYSPYAEDKGYVDVDGLKRGTRVKCPYTQKHFRVP